MSYRKQGGGGCHDLGEGGSGSGEWVLDVRPKGKKQRERAKKKEAFAGRKGDKDNHADATWESRVVQKTRGIVKRGGSRRGGGGELSLKSLTQRGGNVHGGRSEKIRREVRAERAMPGKGKRGAKEGWEKKRLYSIGRGGENETRSWEGGRRKCSADRTGTPRAREGGDEKLRGAGGEALPS